jgi:hypothetical protein
MCVQERSLSGRVVNWRRRGHTVQRPRVMKGAEWRVGADFRFSKAALPRILSPPWQPPKERGTVEA